MHQKNVKFVIINHSLFFKKYSNIKCKRMGISKNEDLKRLKNSVTYDKGVL